MDAETTFHVIQDKKIHGILYCGGIYVAWPLLMGGRRGNKVALVEIAQKHSVCDSLGSQ